MKRIELALSGALAIAALVPLAAQAQSTPPADTTMSSTTTPPTDSTTPPADSTSTTGTTGATSTGTATTGTTTTAPAAAAVATGATVYGSDGAEVGKIESVAGGNAVVNTGTRKATLALNAFGSGPQGPTITVTKSQLEDAVAKATPPAPAATEETAKGKKKGK